MCPFCMATAVWIAAGAVSTGGISTLAVVKLLNKNARERGQEGTQGGTDDKQ